MNVNMQRLAYLTLTRTWHDKETFNVNNNTFPTNVAIRLHVLGIQILFVPISFSNTVCFTLKENIVLLNVVSSICKMYDVCYL